MKVQSMLAGLALVLPLAAMAAEPGSAPFAGVSEMDRHDLGASRGADTNTTIVTSHQDFDAAVQGNAFNVGAMNNGRIDIGEGAFENFSGMGVNVLNTGNANGFSVGIGVSIHLQ
mgnify:CR=1 FL=1